MSSKPPTPTVTAIGNMNWEGNIVPHAWYQHLRTKANTPNTVAIIILSDVIYWYRPVEVRDEATGRLAGYRRKFNGLTLQASYQKYVDMFGFSKGQVKAAFDYMKERGLVRVEFKSFTSKTGMYFSNVMYVEPIPDAIAKINRPLPGDTESCADASGEDEYAPIPTSGMQVPPATVSDTGEDPAVSGETYTEVSGEVSREVSGEPSSTPAPPPASRNNGGQKSPAREVPKSSRPPKGTLNQDQEQVRNRLMALFSDKTSIAVPESYAGMVKMWHRPLEAIAKACHWDYEAAGELIARAITHMDKQNLTVYSPLSVQKVVVGMAAKQQRQGQELEPDFEDAWRGF